MDQLPVSILFKKEGKELVFRSDLDKIKYDNFVKGMENGEFVEVTYEIRISDGSYAQLSKLHKCIRELGNFLGYSFDDMKLEVKERAGLKSKTGYKSFADCSREELSLAIQATIEIGDLVGYSLH
jgi:hypothetical protein